MPEARCSDGGLAPGTQKRGTGAPQLGTPVPQLHLARQQARHDKQPMLPLLQPRSCAALSKSEFTTGHQRPATAGVAGVPRVRAWWAPQTVCVRCATPLDLGASEGRNSRIERNTAAAESIRPTARILDSINKRRNISIVYAAQSGMGRCELRDGAGTSFVLDLTRREGAHVLY